MICFHNFTLFSTFCRIIFILVFAFWGLGPRSRPQKSYIFFIFLVILFSCDFHIFYMPGLGPLSIPQSLKATPTDIPPAPPSHRPFDCPTIWASICPTVCPSLASWGWMHGSIIILLATWWGEFPWKGIFPIFFGNNVKIASIPSKWRQNNVHAIKITSK